MAEKRLGGRPRKAPAKANPRVLAPVTFATAFEPGGEGLVLELPGFKNTALPSQLLQQPTLRSGCVYTVPIELLDRIADQVGVDHFDRHAWELEVDLSARSEDHRSRVGFLLGAPIIFVFLREKPLDKAAIDCLRKISKDADATIRDATNRLNQATRGMRSYLGWLMTNPVFLQEMQALWPHLERHCGPGSMPIPIRRVEARPSGAIEGEVRPDIEDDYRQLTDFCARWRLTELAGPMLPLPASIQMPAPPIPQNDSSLPGHASAKILIPDTMPIPGEKELRRMMEEVIRQNPADHLAEWFKIVRAQNSARSQLDRYARIFEVQHYWRLLQSRHAQALRRSRGRLIDAFSEHFEVSDAAIDRDLKFIEKRLGPSWWERFPIPEFNGSANAGNIASASTRMR